NKSFLSDYQEYDGGFVAFAGNSKDGKITGKGKIRIGKLDFEDVYFVKELKFNLFSVSRMCNKKNSVLFTETECLILSPDFKLPDENQVLLKKGKHQKASCKSKLINSISQPLMILHMDSFGPTFVKSIMGKLYCLVVTDDYNRFSWVFFLAKKDETRGILKVFITRIQNQLNHKVKIIKCDNRTEFKNYEMNQFCRIKRIKREFSNARTPQQNRVAERKNRTLKEVARTMLVDLLLPIPFWAEAANTACYVHNMVLVTKPLNKTPYELLIGKAPIISFMRPFCCLVTILNTLDHLGKFDGKANEGFLVGYSINSKAFRVYNSRTKKVEENPHVNFLENKPNVAGSGPEWLFDINSLTNSKNYQPVNAGNRINVLNKSSNVPSSNEEIESSPKHDASKKSHVEPTYFEGGKINDLGCLDQQMKCTDDSKNTNSTNSFNTASLIVNTASDKDETFQRTYGEWNFSTPIPVNAASSSFSHLAALDDFSKKPNLKDTRIFDDAYDDRDEGAEADYNNLDTIIPISHIPCFVDPQFPDKMYKVDKALYCLYQAPRAWYETLSNYLLENGFRRGTIGIKLKGYFLNDGYADLVQHADKKELAIPGQMETGKEFSNPLMAGGLPKTISAKEEGDRVERAITTDASLGAIQDSDNITKTQTMTIPNVDIPQGIDTGGRTRRQETIRGTSAQTRVTQLETELLTTKAIYNKAFITLINRVKKLESQLKQKRSKAVIHSSDEEGPSNRPFSKAEVRKNMIMYLENQGRYKQSYFKGMKYEDIRPLFERIWDQVHTFVPKDSEIEREVMKRAGFDLQQGSSKKQMLDQQTKETEEEVEAQGDSDQEVKELKLYMRIIPEEDIAIKAIPLAIKPLVIIDYKIVKEGKISTYHITRADESTRRYTSMINLLENIDREDLETL
nr:retrovirus-related Pol polyprotein from transposon TNT 1-94 [Tanacetum cinerariifolium]